MADRRSHEVWEALGVVAVVVVIAAFVAWVCLTTIAKTPAPSVCIAKGYPAGSDGWAVGDVSDTFTAASAEECLQACVAAGRPRMAYNGFEAFGNCSCYAGDNLAWPPDRVLFSDATDASFGIQVENRRFRPTVRLPCQPQCSQAAGPDEPCVGTLVSALPSRPLKAEGAD